MGPEPVWLRLLQLVEIWSREHLGRSAAGVKVLPVIARVSGWSMALDGGSGEVLGFLR